MARSTSTSEAIEWLAEQRRRPDRQSAKTVELGEQLLQTGALSRLGDDLWSFLEQLCMAALDIGRWELAEVCVARVQQRFPESTRMSSLQGMLLEARGEYGKALAFYNEVLKADETDMIIAKRRIAVIKSLPASDARGGSLKAAEALVSYLGTFANDVEAWQELVAIYSELELFDKAIFALEELLLLFPASSFYFLQLAETLYTAGDFARAYKTFLRVLETSDGVEREEGQGPMLRCLWGLKMCTTRILAEPLLGTAGESRAENVPQIDALVTDLLLNKGYKGAAEGIKTTRNAARQVLADSD